MIDLANELQKQGPSVFLSYFVDYATKSIGFLNGVCSCSPNISGLDVLLSI